MEVLLESWSLVVILLSAFVIGWAAEAAQTFMSRALALSLLAWLQTLPEFAVEASIAWHQERDLMIANLTGSLRLLVGLGWPMIFFVHFFFSGFKKKKWVQKIKLDNEDFMSVLFLFISVLYFVYVWAKASLSSWDSLWLIVIYLVYLVILTKLPVHEVEEEEDLPWLSKKIVSLEKGPKIMSTIALFLLGGAALYFSVHPFIDTLQKWSLTLGISTFVFIQWVAPFLSEFPEKVTAFNWARQPNKAPMAVMNMVNSNINQWTMLAAMIPLVFSLSLGRFEALELDAFHRKELLLTIVQSFLGVLLLLDLEFSFVDAFMIFNLWFIQFILPSTHDIVTGAYLLWGAVEIVRFFYLYLTKKQLPKVIRVFWGHLKGV